MVGSKQHGTMVDNDVEAHSGDTIDQIHTASLKSVVYQPNVIVINAGNNDCHLHIDIKNAGARLNSMLDELFERIPDVTIVLSTLIFSTNKDVEEDRGTLNDQIRGLIIARREKKEKIVLAEMTGAGDAFVETVDLTSDGVHPNDGGAKKMGHVFYQAILQAYAEGLITKPNSSDAVPDEVQVAKVSSTTIVVAPTTTSSVIIVPTTTSSTSTTSTTPTPTPTPTSTASSTTTTVPKPSTTTATAAASGNLGAAQVHTKVLSTFTTTSSGISSTTTRSTSATTYSTSRGSTVTSSSSRPTSTPTRVSTTITSSTVRSSPTSSAVPNNAATTSKHMAGGGGGARWVLASAGLALSFTWLL
ncbi:hypothetical protein TruAng_001115 [Truncatella angustata]|nr:hypothetical protein TruAng_001115 [Truncatella angustata]